LSKVSRTVCSSVWCAGIGCYSPEKTSIVLVISGVSL